MVARSVEIGYRVIDDYVRQGESVARALSGSSALSGMVPGMTDGGDLAARMAQQAIELTNAWMQIWQSAAGVAAPWPMPAFGDGAAAGFAGRPLARGAATPAGASPPAGAVGPQAAVLHDEDAERPGAADTAAIGTRVVVALACRRPARVAVDLRPATGGRLTLHALRAPAGDKPRISDVRVAEPRPGEPLALEITVPDDQPPGVYNGIVVDDETGLPLGTVSLRIEGP